MADSPSAPAYRIETPRMILRCWSPADAALLKSTIDGSLAHLQRWLPWAHRHPISLDETIADVRGFRRKFDGDEDFSYGGFDRGEGELFGGGGLHLRSGPDSLEIGYWMRADRSGQGLATELAAALCRAAFEVHGVQRLDIRVAPENQASARVPAKLGFRLEATLRRRLVVVEGELRDAMVWSMLREELGGSPAAALAAEARAFDAAGRRLF
jgi:RimJ/RimL family protein N-acetyltransferase